MSAAEKHQEIMEMHAKALDLEIRTAMLRSAERMTADNLNEHEQASIVGGVLMDYAASLCAFTLEAEAAISMFARLLHAAKAEKSGARQPPAGEA